MTLALQAEEICESEQPPWRPLFDTQLGHAEPVTVTGETPDAQYGSAACCAPVHVSVTTGTNEGAAMLHTAQHGDADE